MDNTKKIKAFEFFTPKYSVVIWASNIESATKLFSERYAADSAIMVVDTEYFAIAHKHILEKKIRNYVAGKKNI